jgi:hypothetical protein
VRDKKLVALVLLLIALSLGHDVDHFARGDIPWHLSPEAALSAVIIVAKYAFLGLALFLYLKNKLGPLFWAIGGGVGVALGWLAHFSPFSYETPQSIYHAYTTPAVGLLAVAWLAALMLVLITIAVYAEYLWARGLQR